MKRLCGKFFITAALFLSLLLLPVVTDAASPSLSDYVDTEHLAQYLQQGIANKYASIDLRKFNIPDSLKEDVELFIVTAAPEATLHSYTVGYDLLGNDPYLQDIRVYYGNVGPQVYAAAEVLLRGVEGNNNLSDLEKALLLHDRLALWCEYDWDGYRSGTSTPNGKNIHGALVERFCVGEGYAEAYRYLLARAGVTSKLIPYTNHMGNEVFLGGKSYKVDVAWDDEGGYESTSWTHPVSRRLFLKSDGYTINGVPVFPYGNDYDYVFWPDRIYLADGKLYGVWENELYRQEDEQRQPLNVSGQECLYISDAALGLEDKLLTTAWGTVQLLDIHTGAVTDLCQVRDSAGELTYIQALEYRDDRVGCLADDRWVYPFEGMDYTVTYRNWDGRVLQTATYEYGQLLRAPAVPQRAGYHFIGWDKAVSVCTGDLELTARFTPYNRPDGWFMENGAWYYRQADQRKIGWHWENGKWYYLEYTGEMVTGLYRMRDTSQHFNIYANTYYFNKSGAMQTGWQEVESGKYYFLPSGEAVTLWQNIDGHRYKFDMYGEMQTGWVYDGGKEYFLDGNTGVVTGWRQLETGFGPYWYYFGTDGDRWEGWQYIGGAWYYLDAQGRMQTGWYRENGVHYYLRDSGTMAVGWQQIGDDWYYFNTSGGLATGWQYLGGNWYYLSKEDYELGKMSTKMRQVDGVQYWFGTDGAMKTGWVQTDSHWRYFKASGAMVTGWLQLGSTWYYMDANGYMVTGMRNIGGTKYYFAGNGAMKTGWIPVPVLYIYMDGTQCYKNSWYYADASGAIRTGWLKQGDVWYYLESGGLMATGRRKIDGKWYTFSENGALIS